MENQSKNKTIVTVIVISYNHSAFIQDCLASIVAQIVDFGVQIIITDDCSTDNTQTIINEFIKGTETQFNFDVILRQKNVGLIQNYFKATEKAKGDFIATISGDDYWLDPAKISKQVHFLTNNPTFSVCFTHFKKLFNDTKLFSEAPLPQKDVFNHQDIARENAVIAGTAMFRKPLLALLPQNKINFQIEDWLMWWFFSQTGNIKMLPDVTLAYRIHENNMYAAIPWAKMRMITLLTKETLNNLTHSVTEDDFLAQEKARFIHVLTSKLTKEDKRQILKLFLSKLPNKHYSLEFVFNHFPDFLFQLYFKIMYRIIYS